MSNMILGWPNYSDPNTVATPSVSGGSWLTALPIANVLDQRLGKVARSTNALAASTKFDCDLGTPRAIRVFALPKHNCSVNAQIRVRGATDSGFTSVVYDSTTVAVYNAALTAEYIANRKAQGINIGYTLVLPTAQTARYWRVEITDTGNGDGYIELGRLVLAAGYQPTYNMDYGMKLGYTTGTNAQEADGGAEWFKVKRSRRTAQFTISEVAIDEALRDNFDLQGLAGAHSQIMFVFDPADTTHMHRRAFLARLQALSALDYPYFNSMAVPYQLVEVL